MLITSHFDILSIRDSITREYRATFKSSLTLQTSGDILNKPSHTVGVISQPQQKLDQRTNMH